MNNVIPTITTEMGKNALITLGQGLQPKGVEVVFTDNKAVELLTQITNETMKEIIAMAKPNKTTGVIDAQSIHIAFGLWARQHRKLDFIAAMERAEEAEFLKK